MVGRRSGGQGCGGRFGLLVVRGQLRGGFISLFLNRTEVGAAEVCEHDGVGYRAGWRRRRQAGVGAWAVWGIVCELLLSRQNHVSLVVGDLFQRICYETCSLKQMI